MEKTLKENLLPYMYPSDEEIEKLNLREYILVIILMDPIKNTN